MTLQYDRPLEQAVFSSAKQAASLLLPMSFFSMPVSGVTLTLSPAVVWGRAEPNFPFPALSRISEHRSVHFCQAEYGSSTRRIATCGHVLMLFLLWVKKAYCDWRTVLSSGFIWPSFRFSQCGAHHSKYLPRPNLTWWEKLQFLPSMVISWLNCLITGLFTPAQPLPAAILSQHQTLLQW